MCMMCGLSFFNSLIALKGAKNNLLILFLGLPKSIILTLFIFSSPNPSATNKIISYSFFFAKEQHCFKKILVSYLVCTVVK